MATDVSYLVPELRVKALQLIANCKARGVEMRPFFTLRSPWDQARIWRSTRSKEEIAATVAELRAKGANFIADMIVKVGPQRSPPGVLGHLTKSLPMQSWHQHGEAIDCFALVNGKAEWRNSAKEYKVYANEAKALGLTAGYFWPTVDAVHVQLRSASIMSVFTWAQLDKLAQERFPKDVVL